MSKNVPVLTATTRRRPSALGGVEHVLGAVDVHRLEVGQVLARPAQQRGAVDGRVAARWRARRTSSASVTSPVTTSTPRSASGAVSALGPGQGPDVVAALDQELADVGAGQSGGAGDEDRLAHADACSGVARRMAVSTCVGS